MTDSSRDVPNAEDATLLEIMFHAERFCDRVEAAIADCAPDQEEDEELRMKISLARNLLAKLQDAFHADALTLTSGSIRADFRYLIITLLWVAFRARRAVDHRLFRMLVSIDASFTYLLIMR